MLDRKLGLTNTRAKEEVIVGIQHGEQTRPSTSVEEWGLTYPGLSMSTDDGNTVSEFTGMWP